MQLHEAFPTLTRDQFITTFRQIADDEPGMEGIAYSGCSPEHIRQYYLDLHDDGDEAKAAFDCDMADLIDSTLAQLGLTEPDTDQLDWKGTLYDWLDDAGFSWYDEGEGEDDE